MSAASDVRRKDNLRRMLSPETIAVIGGSAAAESVRQCRAVGFQGRIWPVHPHRTDLEGLPCYRSAAELPAAPDAALVAVPGPATVDVVGQLAARGTGGAVCHASGFAEHGRDGGALQQQLVDACGDMALIGPNCIGSLDYLGGSALWPDQHGGNRVASGVAVLTQSGNIAQNLTMQRRSLPVARVVTLGNAAVTGFAELIEALLEDPRITAIGLHLEGVADPAGLVRAGLAALRAGIPVVALKSGRSELGAQANLSHTSSLAGSDALCEALFDRAGIARISGLSAFVEALKFLHVHGAAAGASITSASCSGGEAALVADLAEQHGLDVPPFPEPVHERLAQALGDRVPVGNPLDYHTYIWGDAHAQAEVFGAWLGSGADAHLLLVDHPRADRCRGEQWSTAIEALSTAHARSSTAGVCVVSTLPEGLPEQVGAQLLDRGIAPVQGLAECAEAVAAAARIGAAQRSTEHRLPIEPGESPAGRPRTSDEAAGKRELAACGIEVPRGEITGAEQAPDAAARTGFPVVLKAVSAELAHKSEAGAVRIGLQNAEQVRHAVAEMSGLADRFLVERMVTGAVAELIVGVRRDPVFGPALTVGSGGVLVELLRDTTSLLLPVSREQVHEALQRLRIWPVLTGYRGPGADVPAVLDAILAAAAFAHEDPNLCELDINPLLALPTGRGAVAVDALVRRTEQEDDR
ncbi:acetate--CoA ligase family protein [Saccharopolyspora sp. HNM0983]|uniref:Acetate--CoA ligase family protein n=1 Tax=Saccharopolyspora montiporae TaxID=2781240 RepID=A0A929G1T2_9PSEU|nr:acetate--CoA ligase family protein [Saccharopolyspora sp. HNM0983]MBE9376614.1 acetate--CoA ligase family protein [Saccharopolyspora sp. HNM0983]